MATSNTPANGAAPAQAAVGPFRGGTQPTLSSDGYVNATALTTTATQLPNYEPSPNNLLRSLWIQVTGATATNAATVAFASTDFPLGVYSTVVFQDSNQKPIIGPFDSYTLAMANKYFGYDANGDPRASAVYSATVGAGATAGSFNFVLRVPIECVPRTGVGSLQNQSSNSTFTLSLTLNTSANVYSVAPTNAVTVTTKIYEGGYWKGSNAAFSSTPKAAGSTNYITRGSYMSLSGSVQQQLSQGLGYPIRNLMHVNYATGGARSSADYPDPIQFIYKGSNLWNTSQNIWKDQMSRWFDLQSQSLDVANGLDTGVFVMPFDVDFGLAPGAELGLNYLATDQGDLFQVLGSWAASSTLYNVVNYIAPVGGVSALQAAS